MNALGKLTIVSTKIDGNLIDEWIWKEDIITYEDKFGRQWKLEPIDNQAIGFPFRILPIKVEIKVEKQNAK